MNDHMVWCQSVTDDSYKSPCVFGDLLLAVPRDSFLPTDTFQQKLRKLDAVDFMQKQYCYGCQKFCELFSSENQADLEVAGLPCTDQSLAGRQAREEGPTAPVFIVHAKIHIEKRTPIIVLENVPDAWSKKCICVRFGS